MFLIIRHEREGVKDVVCFVQAKTIQEAKRMVSIPEDSIEWLHIPDILITTLLSNKEGYFVVDIEIV